MKKINPLVFIFITVFVDLVGFGIVIPLLPLYVTKFGVGPSIVGMLVAIFSLTQFIGSPILGRMSDKYGRRPLLAVSLLGTSLGYVITAFAPTILFVFVGRIIDGITGGNISVAQAYIADTTEKKDRARAMGLIGAAFGLGFIVGPAIGGLLSTISLMAPFVFAAVLSLINAIGVLLFLPESRKFAMGPRKQMGMFSIAALKEAFTPLQVGAFVGLFFLINLGFSMIHGTGPLLTQLRFGWGAAENGYFFASFGVIGVITQAVLIGPMVKRFGELVISIAGIAILAVGLFFMGGAQSAMWLYVGGVGIGLGNGLIQPSLQGLISRVSTAKEQGGVLGIAQGFGSLARTAGPLYGGLVFELIGSAFPYYSGGVVLAGAVLISIVYFRWLKAV